MVEDYNRDFLKSQENEQKSATECKIVLSTYVPDFEIDLIYVDVDMH